MQACDQRIERLSARDRFLHSAPESTADCPRCHKRIWPETGGEVLFFCTDHGNRLIRTLPDNASRKIMLELKQLRSGPKHSTPFMGTAATTMLMPPYTVPTREAQHKQTKSF